jgi:hypothetical protein
MAPLISILIPCFNAERWIGRAIESAINQTWDNKEIIVVDDGSTDRSLDVLKQGIGFSLCLTASGCSIWTQTTIFAQKKLRLK